MSQPRMTRQGIRALDPPGHNGHPRARSVCLHNFNGASEVIGRRWTMDGREEPVYGHRCLLFGCGETWSA